METVPHEVRDKSFFFFSRSNTVSNTALEVRDEMYGNGGTDLTERNMYNLDKFAQCLVDDPEVLDINGWVAFRRVYDGKKQEEADVMSERGEAAKCIVLLLTMDSGVFNHYKEKDDDHLAELLSVWLEDIDSTSAASDVLYPMMQALTEDEDGSTPGEHTLIGHVMRSDTHHRSALLFVDAVAPFAVAASPARAALIPYMSVIFDMTTEAVSHVMDSWDVADEFGEFVYSEDPIPSGAQSWLNDLRAEMDTQTLNENARILNENARNGNLNEEQRNQYARNIWNEQAPTEDLEDLPTEEVMRTRMANTIMLYGVYGTVQGAVSDPDSVEAWLGVGSTIAEISDAVAESVATALARNNWMRTFP